MHVDPAALQRTVDWFQRAPLEATPLETVLSDAVVTVTALMGATGTGLMLADEGAVLRYVAATDPAAKVLEEVQERLGTGPCIDCVIENELIVTDDLAADGRWPEVATVVVPRGVRSMVGAPVLLGGAPVGSLNIYDADVREWDDSDREAARTLAQSFSVLVDSALHRHRGDQLVEQLQKALDNRVVIERAVGYVMAMQRLDTAAAFEHLRRLARNERITVAARAERLLLERPDPSTAG